MYNQLKKKNKNIIIKINEKQIKKVHLFNRENLEDNNKGQFKS